jgi:hypothetical protein
MILDPDPAALIGQAAAARVAELQQTLQRFRREHEAADGTRYQGVRSAHHRSDPSRPC